MGEFFLEKFSTIFVSMSSYIVRCVLWRNRLAGIQPLVTWRSSLSNWNDLSFSEVLIISWTVQVFWIYLSRKVYWKNLEQAWYLSNASRPHLKMNLLELRKYQHRGSLGFGFSSSFHPVKIIITFNGLLSGRSVLPHELKRRETTHFSIMPTLVFTTMK